MSRSRGVRSPATAGGARAAARGVASVVAAVAAVRAMSADFILALIFGPALLFLACGLFLSFLGFILRLPVRGSALFMRSLMRWRAVPLPQKNTIRATMGAGGLVACLVVAAHGFAVLGVKATAALALISLLYLVVGLVSTIRADRLTFDVMAVFWRCALVVGCAGLLIYAKLEGL